MAVKSQATPKPLKIKEPISLPKSATTEIGVFGEAEVSSYYSQERRTDDLSIRDFRRMKDNDGQIQMMLNAINNTIRAAGLEILDDQDYIESQGDGEEENDSEEKIFIEQNLFSPKWKGGMSQDIDLINRINLRAFEEGFRIYEVIYRNDDDGFVRLDRLAPRAMRVTDFELQIITDDHGGYKGFHQVTSFRGVPVNVFVLNDSEIDKTINVVFGQEYGSNYGRSGLKAAYYHYDKAHKGMYLNHIAHELGSVKYRHVRKKGNATNTEDGAMMDALSRAGSENIIVYDEKKYDLTFEDVSDANVMLAGKDMIDYHTAQMAKSVLAQFIDMGSQISKTGARSAGKDQMLFFKNGLQSVAQILIEQPWNKLIADIIRINFNNGIYPRMRVKPIEDSSVEALYAAFQQLAKNGELTDSIKSKLFMRTADKLGLDVTEESIETEMIEMKEEKKAEADAQMQMQKESMNKKPINNAEYTDSPIAPRRRELYPDEAKVQLSHIKNRFTEASLQATAALTERLSKQKMSHINSYTQAMLGGHKSMGKVTINLDEDMKYSDALKLLALAMYEEGKSLSAMELDEDIPTTTKKQKRMVLDEVEAILDKQASDLAFRLRAVGTNALRFGLPQNEAQLDMEKEYDSFFASVLPATLGALIPQMFNWGRQATFDTYKEDIFAYRYTAILDDRTTEYCEHMDGRVFQESDPNFAKVTPPNHFNCRSIWTAITKDEQRENPVHVTGLGDLPSFPTLNSFRDIHMHDNPEKEVLQLIESI